jgi:flagellar biosynthetic protein FliO
MRVLVVASLVCLLAPSLLRAQDDDAPAQVALTPPVENGPSAPPSPSASSGTPTAPVDDTSPQPLNGDARDDFEDLSPRENARPDAMQGLMGVLLKTMLMLALVVGAAYLTLHKGVGKLMARAQQGQRIKVVERVHLGERRSLYLVSVDGKEMLLGVGEGGISTLEAPAAREGARFASLLDVAHAAPGENGAKPHQSANAVVDTMAHDADRRNDV